MVVAHLRYQGLPNSGNNRNIVGYHRMGAYKGGSIFSKIGNWFKNKVWPAVRDKVIKPTKNLLIDQGVGWLKDKAKDIVGNDTPLGKLVDEGGKEVSGWLKDKTGGLIYTGNRRGGLIYTGARRGRGIKAVKPKDVLGLHRMLANIV